MRRCWKVLSATNFPSLDQIYFIDSSLSIYFGLNWINNGKSGHDYTERNNISIEWYLYLHIYMCVYDNNVGCFQVHLFARVAWKTLLWMCFDMVSGKTKFNLTKSVMIIVFKTQLDCNSIIFLFPLDNCPRLLIMNGSVHSW